MKKEYIWFHGSMHQKTAWLVVLPVGSGLLISKAAYNKFVCTRFVSISAIDIWLPALHSYLFHDSLMSIIKLLNFISF